MLIIAQVKLYLGEDFQVIINEKWKYRNQDEFYLLFTHSISLSLKLTQAQAQDIKLSKYCVEKKMEKILQLAVKYIC